MDDAPRPRGRPKGTGKPTQPVTLVDGRARRNWTLDDPPSRVRNFVRWFAWERGMGDTVVGYGQANGVPLATLNMWLRDTRVLTLLDQALYRSNAGPIRVQEVLDMLHRRATQNDDVKAASVYLQAVDKLVPRSRVDVVHHDARSLSDHELHAELRRAVQLLEEQRGVLDVPIEEAEVIEESS